VNSGITATESFNRAPRYLATFADASELCQGHGRLSLGIALFAAEGVRSADDVRLDRLHRSGPVEKDFKVAEVLVGHG
jgi:hypothetical protein